jgi:hypothetical protein
MAGATGAKGVTGEVGPSGPAGPTGPAGPANVTRVPGATVAVGGTHPQGYPVGPAQAQCPVAETLVGGGAEIKHSGGNALGVLATSYPSSPLTLGGTWKAEGVWVGETGTVEITAYALCAG